MESRFWKYFAFVFLQVLLVSADSKERPEMEKEVLQRIFLSGKFNTYVKPVKNVNQSTEEPLDIFVSLYVLNIDVDMKNEECSVQMYFRQEWNDSRLSYNEQVKGKLNVLPIHDAAGIWTPDLFFVNAKHGHLHTLTKPNVFVRIFPEGRVLYSERVMVKFACPMDLRKYPFDTQICAVLIESYGYTASDLVLKWKHDTTYGITERPGYEISYSIAEHLVQMSVSNYTRIELGIHLTRSMYPQLLHVYIPLALLVATSWVSFCFRPSDQIPRLATIITITFATLIFIQSVKEFLYQQCYLTALDVWVGFSCLLVFAAFFENVYVIANGDGKPLSYQSDGIPNKKDIPELRNEEQEKRKLIDILAGKLHGKDSNLDAVARMTFPSVFVLFNVIYLAYYLI